LTMSSGNPNSRATTMAMAANASLISTLDRADVPAGARQRLPHRGHRPEPEHAGLDGRNAVGHKARLRRKSAFVRPSRIRKHHGRSRIVQSRRIAGGDGAIRTEGGLQLGERFERGVGPIGFVLVEPGRALLARHLDGDDLRLEMTGGLRRGKKLLRAQRPAVLRLARDLIFLDQVFGVPAGMLVGKRVVSIDPGDIALTRMRSDFRSVVQVRANERTAALVAL
jgi:hypothetical protein